MVFAVGKLSPLQLRYNTTWPVDSTGLVSQPRPTNLEKRAVWTPRYFGALPNHPAGHIPSPKLVEACHTAAACKAFAAGKIGVPLNLGDWTQILTKTEKISCGIWYLGSSPGNPTAAAVVNPTLLVTPVVPPPAVANALQPGSPSAAHPPHDPHHPVAATPDIQTAYEAAPVNPVMQEAARRAANDPEMSALADLIIDGEANQAQMDEYLVRMAELNALAQVHLNAANGAAGIEKEVESRHNDNVLGGVEGAQIATYGYMSDARLHTEAANGENADGINERQVEHLEEGFMRVSPSEETDVGGDRSVASGIGDNLNGQPMPKDLGLGNFDYGSFDLNRVDWSGYEQGNLGYGDYDYGNSDFSNLGFRDIGHGNHGMEHEGGMAVNSHGVYGHQEGTMPGEEIGNAARAKRGREADEDEAGDKAGDESAVEPPVKRARY